VDSFNNVVTKGVTWPCKYKRTIKDEVKVPAEAAWLQIKIRIGGGVSKRKCGLLGKLL
jgi:hypothetical protein